MASQAVFPPPRRLLEFSNATSSRETSLHEIVRGFNKHHELVEVNGFLFKRAKSTVSGSGGSGASAESVALAGAPPEGAPPPPPPLPRQAAPSPRALPPPRVSLLPGADRGRPPSSPLPREDRRGQPPSPLSDASFPPLPPRAPEPVAQGSATRPRRAWAAEGPRVSLLVSPSPRGDARWAAGAGSPGAAARGLVRPAHSRDSFDADRAGVAPETPVSRAHGGWTGAEGGARAGGAVGGEAQGGGGARPGEPRSPAPVDPYAAWAAHPLARVWSGARGGGSGEAGRADAAAAAAAPTAAAAAAQAAALTAAAAAAQTAAPAGIDPLSTPSSAHRSPSLALSPPAAPADAPLRPSGLRSPLPLAERGPSSSSPGAAARSLLASRVLCRYAATLRALGADPEGEPEEAEEPALPPLALGSAACEEELDAAVLEAQCASAEAARGDPAREAEAAALGEACEALRWVVEAFLPRLAAAAAEGEVRLGEPGWDEEEVRLGEPWRGQGAPPDEELADGLDARASASAPSPSPAAAPFAPREEEVASLRPEDAAADLEARKAGLRARIEAYEAEVQAWERLEADLEEGGKGEERKKNVETMTVDGADGDAEAGPGASKGGDAEAGPGASKGGDAEAGPGASKGGDAEAGPGASKGGDAEAGPGTSMDTGEETKSSDDREAAPRVPPESGTAAGTASPPVAAASAAACAASSRSASTSSPTPDPTLASLVASERAALERLAAQAEGLSLLAADAAALTWRAEDAAASIAAAHAREALGALRGGVGAAELVRALAAEEAYATPVRG